MPLVARIGDRISHGGSIVQGSPDTKANGIAVARVGDAVVCAIHGPQVITSGSSKGLVNGKQRARIGDKISCGATITGSSPDVAAG